MGPSLFGDDTEISCQDVPVETWVNSLCSLCGSGCGLQVGIAGNRAVAVRGRPHYPVNQGRLCIKGYYGWKALYSPQRATTPMVRKNGRLVPCSWGEALDIISGRIREALAIGPQTVGVYNSGQLTLEECYAMGKLARGVMGTSNIDANLRLCMASTRHAFIRAFGTDGVPGCYVDLDLADCILIFGCNPAEMFPELWQRIKARHRKGAKLIVVDPRRTATASEADLHLQLKPGQNVPLLNAILFVLFEKGLVDGDFVNNHTLGWEDLRRSVTACTPEKVADTVGVNAKDIRVAAETLGEAQRFTSLYMQGVFQSTGGTDAANLLIDLHLITGNISKPGTGPLALAGQSNAMGNRVAGGSSSFVGLRNARNPLHRSEVAVHWGIDESILPFETNDVFEMLDEIEGERLKIFWCISSNPAVSMPDLGRVHQLLDKVFLVVQDIYYPVETAEFADVFLPAAGWGEKAGTFVNSERRVGLVEKFKEPPGQARSDLEIFQQVATGLGYGRMFGWNNPEAVFEEWKQLSRGRPCDMYGISYERLRQNMGLQYPCYDTEHPGTQRLYVDGKFATDPAISEAYGDFNSNEQKARLWRAEPVLFPEAPDDKYPFWLNTGRLLEHYHTLTKTMRVPELRVLAPEAFAEISSMDAANLGIKKGERIKVISPRGSISVVAKISKIISPGQIFIPFHFGDIDWEVGKIFSAANRLTHSQRDRRSDQPWLKLSVCRLEKETLQ